MKSNFMVQMKNLKIKGLIKMKMALNFKVQNII